MQPSDQIYFEQAEEIGRLRRWISDCWSVFGWYQEWLERLKHDHRTAEANKQAALDALTASNEQLVQMTAYAAALKEIVDEVARHFDYDDTHDEACEDAYPEQCLRGIGSVYAVTRKKVQREAAKEIDP